MTDPSAAPATLAGDTDAAGAVAGVFVRYTEICNAVRAQMVPGVSLPAQDAKFDAMMKARKARS